jgi:hypothetical protein
MIKITGAIAIATVIAVTAAAMLDRSSWKAFFSSLLLNLIAEMLGLTGALWAAWWFAKKRLAVVGPRLTELVTQLRRDGRLSAQAARESVACAVGLIAEDPRTFGRVVAEVPCNVCTLPSPIQLTKRNRRVCGYCGLPEGTWKSVPPPGLQT